MAKKRHRGTGPSQRPRPSEGFFEKHGSWIPLAVIFVLLLIFFSEVLFRGKTLLPPDSLAARSYRPFVQDALKRGIYPLWNPYIFSGMPSFASLSSAPYVDLLGDVINGLLWPFRRLSSLPDFWRILINYFLFGALTFLLLWEKTRCRPAALFSALSLVFTTPVVAFAAFGHNTKLLTASLIPLAFYLTDRLLETRRLTFSAALGLALGLQLLRAHIQIAYYSSLMLGLYVVYRGVVALREKDKGIWRGIGLWVWAVAIGLVISSWLYLSVFEYSHYSIRGRTGGGLSYDYATSWSFWPAEMLTFLVPSFMGFGGGTYWGHMPFTDFPLYMGVIPLIFAGAALVLRRDRYTLFFAFLGVFALLVSFGKEFPVLYGPMFKLLPFFNKFRVPSMIQILLQFSVAILAGFGMAELLQGRFRGKERVLKRYLEGFGIVCGGLFLFLFLFKGTYLSWASQRSMDPQASYSMALRDAIKMIVLVGVMIYLTYLYIKGKIKTNLWTIGGMALLLGDLWSVDFKIVDPKPQVQERWYFAEDDVVRFLKRAQSEGEVFRILPVSDGRPANWYMYHRIQSAYGYHAAKLRIYQEVLSEFQLPQGFLLKFLKRTSQGRYMFRGPEEVPRDLRYAQNALLDMLNVRYIICPYPIPDEDYKLVFNGERRVYENTTVLPRAFFPDSVVVLRRKEAIFRLFRDKGFRPERVAILEEPPPFSIGPAKGNKVRFVHYDLHDIRLETQVVRPALLVLGEIYYPAGWKAYVDEEPVHIYKVNYLLRGVFLQPGSHQVVFRFQPRAFRIGLALTMFTFVGTSVLLVGCLYRERRGKEGRC